MEGAHFLATNKLISLSEQQLTSCDPNSDGCDGGLQTYAFDYLKTHPQELESDYPYTSGHGDSGHCKEDTALGKVLCTSYQMVKAQSVDALKSAIKSGPVALTIEAD